MIKKLAVIIAVLVFLMFGILTVRFLFGGPEDDWICVRGQWVRHGSPRAPMPTEECKGK